MTTEDEDKICGRCGHKNVYHEGLDENRNFKHPRGKCTFTHSHWGGRTVCDCPEFTDDFNVVLKENGIV